MDEDTTAIEDLTFEQAVEKLEGLVEALESGDCPLDALVRDYERGAQLVRHCQQRLKTAELAVEKIRLEAEPAGADAL